MSMLSVFTGFVPWVVFTLVASRTGPGGVTTAALLAFLVAAAFVVRSMVRGESPKLLEVTGALVFAVFAGVGALTPAVDPFLAAYGRALAAFVLAAVIVALLPVLPFTEQYAREGVPREYWDTPGFRSVNRRISAAWGGVVAAMGVSHTLAGLLETPDPGVRLLHRPVDLVFNWVVPGLLVWAAARYTRRVAGRIDDVPAAPGARARRAR